KMPLPASAVIARVDGQPILASEILDVYSGQLKQYDAILSAGQAQGQIDEANRNIQFRKAQESIIRKDLPKMIEQTLMVNAVKSKLKKENLDSLEKQIDVFFEKQVEDMKVKAKVGSTAELEAYLQQQGMSLEMMRKVISEKAISQEFVKAKIGQD